MILGLIMIKFRSLLFLLLFSLGVLLQAAAVAAPTPSTGDYNYDDLRHRLENTSGPDALDAFVEFCGRRIIAVPQEYDFSIDRENQYKLSEQCQIACTIRSARIAFIRLADDQLSRLLVDSKYNEFLSSALGFSFIHGWILARSEAVITPYYVGKYFSYEKMYQGLIAQVESGNIKTRFNDLLCDGIVSINAANEVRELGYFFDYVIPLHYAIEKAKEAPVTSSVTTAAPTIQKFNPALSMRRIIQDATDFRLNWGVKTERNPFVFDSKSEVKKKKASFTTSTKKSTWGSYAKAAFVVGAIAIAGLRAYTVRDCIGRAPYFNQGNETIGLFDFTSPSAAYCLVNPSAYPNQEWMPIIQSSANSTNASSQFSGNGAVGGVGSVDDTDNEEGEEGDKTSVDEEEYEHGSSNSTTFQGSTELMLHSANEKALVLFNGTAIAHKDDEFSVILRPKDEFISLFQILGCFSRKYQSDLYPKHFRNDVFDHIFQEGYNETYQQNFIDSFDDNQRKVLISAGQQLNCGQIRGIYLKNIKYGTLLGPQRQTYERLKLVLSQKQKEKISSLRLREYDELDDDEKLFLLLTGVIDGSKSSVVQRIFTRNGWAPMQQINILELSSKGQFNDQLLGYLLNLLDGGAIEIGQKYDPTTRKKIHCIKAQVSPTEYNLIYIDPLTKQPKTDRYNNRGFIPPENNYFLTINTTN